MSISRRAAVFAGGLLIVLAFAFGGLEAQQGSACALCDEGAALAKRFDLPEAAAPVRQRSDWAPPTRIVTFGGEEWAAGLRAVVPDAEIVGVDNIGAALAALPGADVYIGLCNADVLRAGTRLRWIQLISAGAERCAPMPEDADRQILITNAQAIFGPQLADHALGMLLTLTRRLRSYHDQQRSGGWSNPGAGFSSVLHSDLWELDGKTMLIVGLGGIGTEIARRAHAFGMRITATRNSSREGPDFVEYVGLAHEAVELASRADVVVNAAPLTAHTRGMFDRQFFHAMKPGAYFINIARGSSVVTADLVQALKSGRMAGAALDVTNPEPLPPDHPLWSMHNVVLTPHVGGASDQVQRRLLALAAENLRRYANGDRMLSVVDPQRGY